VILRCTALGLIVILSAAAGFGCGSSNRSNSSAGDPTGAPAFARQEPFVTRPFRPVLGDRWIGDAINYGPHRDGQHPGGPSPSREELRQDLELMLKHWNLLRVYQAAGVSEELVKLIHEDRLDMRVVLGIWIKPEDRRDADGRVLEELPLARAANRQEIEAGIRLAKAYPHIVIALIVGSESQIYWSDHRVPTPLLIGYLREVRARSEVPVTTADDFNFWNKPESLPVAREIDLVFLHAHPLWNGVQLEDALDWAEKTYRDIQAHHPGHLVVYGETGWATQKHNVGEQATLIKGQPGEAEQQRFHDAVTAWCRRERITTFFFEAFDENWKGGSHPDEVEKHWGLYRADRTPKPALGN